MNVKSPLRLFLDANVLISAAWKESGRILAMWDLPHVRLITSEYPLAEAQRNLFHEARRARLRHLLTGVEIIASGTISLSQEVELPEKDLPVLADAVAAKADYLVTGDKRHFGQWYGKRLLGIRVYPPGDLVELLYKQNLHPRDRSL